MVEPDLESIIDGPPLEVHETLLSRRALLGLGGVAAALLVTGNIIGHRIQTEHEREKIEDAFRDGLENTWNQFVVFPGLLAVSPEVPLYTDIIQSRDSRVIFPLNQKSIIVAGRPIFVKRSLVLNNDPSGAPDGQSLYSSKPTLPEGLMAFWLPGPGRMIYTDSKVHAGLLTPFMRPTTGVKQTDQSRRYIVGTKVQIDGRETHNGVAYPYVTKRHLVRRSMTPDETAELNSLYGQYPVNWNSVDNFWKKTYPGRPRDYVVQNADFPLGHSISARDSQQLNMVISAWLDDSDRNHHEPLAVPRGAK